VRSRRRTDVDFTAGPAGETHGLFGELGVAGEDEE
jgi:hypothetical protein